MRLVHKYATSHIYHLIMSFSVEENAVFIYKFSKKSPYRGGGTTPSHTPSHPRSRSARSGSVVSLPRILPPPPLRWNPGYATVLCPKPSKLFQKYQVGNISYPPQKKKKKKIIYISSELWALPRANLSLPPTGQFIITYSVRCFH